MKYKFGKTVVMALGGSIVHPDEIDAAFLKDFKKFLKPFIARGMRFVLVVGGGTLSRRFQVSAGKVARVTDEDKDWLGVHATRLNAHLLRTIFHDVADPVIMDSRKKVKRLRHPITIGAGWRPGWSTDYVAMQIAADLGVPETVIAGTPTHVYEKDPHHFPHAKRFNALTWKDYRKLIPKKWKPGLHAPMDPVGAKLGERTGVKAIVLDGRDVKNFKALLSGSEFRGTIIG